jgi:hypothetical protein
VTEEIPVAITVLGGEPATRAMAVAAIARARRTMPKLGRTGRDIIVVTADSRGYDPAPRRLGSGLIVMTDRPSVVQAAAALLMGADAYLPVDLHPSRAAQALDRVMRGRTHIEPETAEALRTLVMLAGGLQPDVRAQEVRLLLDLRSRGWGWGEAADSVGVDPRAARAWLEDLLLRIRPADSRTSSPVRGGVGSTSGQAKYRDSPVATDGSVQEY